MNIPALRLQEQIINMLPAMETEVYEGWILKKLDSLLLIYPLYHISNDYLDERIQMCERIGSQKAADCVFRIVEHTNHYLRSRLEENQYVLQECSMIGELCITEEVTSRIQTQNEKWKSWEVNLTLEKQNNGKSIESVMLIEDSDKKIKNQKRLKYSAIGTKRADLIFLFGGTTDSYIEISDLLRFSMQSGVKRILVNIPGRNLDENYEKYGFQRVYSYYCYQKQKGD